MKTIKYIPFALFLCLCLCCGTSEKNLGKKNQPYWISNPEIQDRIYKYSGTVDRVSVPLPNDEEWDGGVLYKIPYHIIFHKDSVYMWPNAFGRVSPYELEYAVPQPFQRWDIRIINNYLRTIQDSTICWVGNSYSIDPQTGRLNLSVRDWWPMTKSGNEQYYIESIDEKEMFVWVDFDHDPRKTKEKWHYKAFPKGYRDTLKTNKFFKSKLDLVNYLRGCVGQEPIVVEEQDSNKPQKNQ